MSIMSKNIADKVSDMLAERDELSRPIWVRAPRGGTTEYFTSLSRGKMYALEAAGLVKTASLKPKGAVRGVKLFSLQSLLSYVESCVSTDCTGKESDAPANQIELGSNYTSTPTASAHPVNVEQQAGAL
jgi:hypothetical protein